MTLIGVVGCCGLWALDRTLELAPATAIAPSICMQPLWGGLLQWIWRGQPPGLAAVAGAGMVLSSMAVAAAWRRGKDYEAPAE